MTDFYNNALGENGEMVAALWRQELSRGLRMDKDTREAIAALSRPLPGAVEAEPSDGFLLVIARSIGRTCGKDNHMERAKDVWRSLVEVDVALPQPNSIDLAPRDAAAYARGVEDAAKVAMRHKSKIAINEPLWHDGADWACQRIEDAIRALLPKEPATEDAREKEVTDHEAFGAMIHRGKQEARGNGNDDPDY